MSRISPTMSRMAKLQLEPGSWEETFNDIYVGITLGISHSFGFLVRILIDPFRLGLGLGQKGPQKISHDDQALKVVGVGYGRTGTYSLTLALEELGLPTLHTSHLFEHVEHEDVVAMWVKEVFQPSIEKRNATLGSLDLKSITGHGFRATCDLPMALYYEQVLREYPDCKFILTTRTNSEEWFRSWDTLTKSIEKSAGFGNVFSAVKPFLIYIRWLFAMVNEDNSYLTSPYPLPEQNKEACIASYEAHNRRVREVIPKRQLLEYNVKQGWEPLCNFLEVENCPNTPFPKSNSARFVQVQALSSFFIPSLTAAILCASCLKIFGGFGGRTGKTVFRWADRKGK